MSTILKVILDKIKAKNPKHYEKLVAHLEGYGADYENLANSFFNKYNEYLERNQKSIDFGVDCYLHMIDDMLEERFKFIREGKYSNSSFDDVEKRIYGNPEIMTYHMHGLVLAQFLWFDQYERILFFIENINKYAKDGKKYLEIGGGHGLYMNEAVNLLTNIEKFDLVDISQSSLDLARGIINTNKVNYFLKNIFDFRESETYDFITMGEVLEHVEEPLNLLNKINQLLNKDGVCYITTPINAPMIDHIYLFHNETEIRDMLHQAGFEIIEERIVISEKITEKQAAKFKVPVMYAAFIKKQ